MNRKEILKRSKDIVCSERETEYGDVNENFKIIANFWSDYLGVVITEKDVSCMMSLLKIARIKTGEPKLDNYIDAIGYLALGGEICANSETQKTEQIEYASDN